MADEERRRRWVPLVSRMLTIAGAVLLLGGFVWLWWLGVPELYRRTPGVGPADQLKAITETRTALLAGLAAVGALGALWLNARTQRFTAKTLRISEANFRLAERSHKESFALAERGHLTDRYTRAIEQLGDDNLNVRLGGIYALEQLATDSPRDRDQATIVEVLSAFVRVQSVPLNERKASLPMTAALEADSVGDERLKANKYIAERTHPPVDVQAAVTVLGRLPTRSRLLRRADLEGSYLTGVSVRFADLTFSDLRRANLTEAQFLQVDLTGAYLGWANLTGADLSKVNLTSAFLGSANLTRARLKRADLTEAYLGEANLGGADLGGANLTQEQLDVSRGDETTILPEGLSRPKQWMLERASERDDGAPKRA